MALTLQWHGTSSEDRASPVTLMPPRQSRPSTWECQATCGSRCAPCGVEDSFLLDYLSFNCFYF